MKFNYWLVTTIVLILPWALVTKARAQQHAPTVEICQADAALWGDSQTKIEYSKAETDKVNNDTPNRSEIAKLRFSELSARSREMFACQIVNADRERSYFDVGQFYMGVQADRWQAFLYRHNLMVQFIEEDNAGKR